MPEGSPCILTLCSRPTWADEPESRGQVINPTPLGTPLELPRPAMQVPEALKSHLPSMSKRKHFKYPPSVNPDRDKAIALPDAEVKRVFSDFQRMKKAGAAVEKLDAEDVRYVAAYLLDPSLSDSATWGRIAAGGELGYSLLKHEVVEIEHLLRHDIDPLDARALVENYAIQRTAHAMALMVEHEFSSPSPTAWASPRSASVT